MRIGDKLLATYLILIGLIAVSVGFGLPHWVEQTVTNAEQSNLSTQARTIAERIAQSAKDEPVLPSDRGSESFINRLLVDETMAIVNPNGVIVRAFQPQLKGRSASRICTAPPNADPAARRVRPQLQLEGVGVVIAACVPIPSDSPEISGYSVLLIRDLKFVQSLSRPITNQIIAVVALGLVAALVIAGLFSRALVKRLQATGAAARALAEGDLSSRAPSGGNDEISELAGHFNHMADRLQALVGGLRRSEQSRRDVMMMVGHDLRTPMTSIAGFAEALKDGMVQDEERKQRYYQIIASESARLTRMINDLFDVAKLEAGQMDLRLQSMAIASWLVEFTEGIKPVAETGGVHLSLAVSPAAEAARIYGDRDRLDQVLGNLVNNAVRFSPQGQQVVIDAHVEDKDVVISVTDHGPGLTPEEAARVFDRFYQAESQRHGHKGAGLGLAIVKSLVEAHGGSVGVETTPGNGATFWFRLKLRDSRVG